MADKSTLEKSIESSKQLRPGGDHYRAFVGPPAQYDFMGGTQFALLFLLGLREEHHICDLGCGSLRAGRFLIHFLLPRRYFGVEPNSWLWEEALRTEIGQDIVSLKQPHFSNESSFTLTNFEQPFDFIVAQSIFSHTGNDILDHAFRQSANALKPTGQFIFTVLDENTVGYDRMLAGRGEGGWIYPECVTYTRADIFERCHTAGLHIQRLNWFHPRQSWYRAVVDRNMLLSDHQLENMGNGKPLFDTRFTK